MKAAVLAATLALACDAVPLPDAMTVQQQVRPIDGEVGTDGYVFQQKDFERTDIKLVVHVFSTREELRAYFFGRYKVPNPGLLAFQYYAGGTCHIHIIDPATFYEPDIIGHELAHCIYGQFHPGQNQAR